MHLPKYIDQVLLEQLVYEQLGGFLLILQPNGKIVFISHTVENLLGHLQVIISPTNFSLILKKWPRVTNDPKLYITELIVLFIL